MKPTFSFVIPVYNTEKYLTRCLESVLAQTCSDFEVVVVDDCSKGNCREIVEEFSSRLPRIRYVSHERNRSVLQARITGAIHALGKYIVPLDPDDYVHPHLIEKLKGAIKECDWAIIAYQMEEEDVNGKATPAWHNHAQAMMTLSAMCDEVISLVSPTFLTGKSFLRRLFLEAVKWLNIKESDYTNCIEDMCLLFAFLVCCKGHVKFIDYVGYSYCENQKSLTRDGSLRAFKLRARSCKVSEDILVAALSRHKCPDELIAKIKNRCEMVTRWMISELKELSPQSWSDCINVLCTLYDPELVLRLVNKLYPDMLKRYAPTKVIIPSQKKINLQCRTIGIICCSSSGGGTERATVLWAQAMRSRGYSIIWFCDDSYVLQMEEFAKIAGISTVPLSTKDQPARWNVLKEAAIKHEIDLFLLTDYYREQILRDLLLVKSLGRKAIVAEHNMYFAALENLCFDLYKERARFYPLADAVTVLSPENVAWWHAAGLQSVVYMPNLLTFKVKTATLLNRHKQLIDSFLFVGRITESKQADKVIEAFAKYRELEQDSRTSRLTLLGRFENHQIEREIRGKIERLGLKAVVDMPGAVADVAPYYRRADILLMASRFEGAPMVINEAKAKGLPVIMFDLPYVEGTRPGEGVVTVPMNDVEAMAREMKSCMTDKKKYERLSQEGRKSLKKYETGTVMKRWEKLLDVVESHTITPERLEPMCEAVSPERMLPMTMNEISSFVSAIQSRWDSLWGENYAIAADRDRICGERHFWESEFQRISNSRSFKIGRAVTWPLRMVRNSFLVLRYEGFAAFCRRVPRKIANLKRRFFG